MVEGAVAALDPEPERARHLIDRRGAGPRTARYLAGRGFGEEASRPRWERLLDRKPERR